MRRLGPWLLLATLAAAQEPERVLAPNSTAAFQLAAEASATFRVDVPEGSVVHLMLHEERGIAGKFTVRDSTGAVAVRLNPVWRVPASQSVTLLGGSYRVAIEPAYHAPVERRFSVETSGATTETDADRRQHAAEILLGEGELIASQNEAGYLTDSLRKFEGALAIWEQAGKSPGMAHTLYCIGVMQHWLGDMPKARATFQRALEIWAAASNDLGQASALHGIAFVDDDSGKAKTAIEMEKRALEIRRSQGSRRSQGESLLEIGGMQRILGDTVSARASLDEAVRLMVEDGDRPMESSTRTTIGVMEFQQGNFVSAEKYYQEALSIDRENHSGSHEAIVLSNLGTLYLDSGDPRRGVRALEEALPLRKALGIPGSHAVTLYNLARAHDTLGEYQAALDELNEALPLFHQRHYLEGEAYAMQELAELYTNTFEPGKAEPLLKQALEIRRTTSDRRGEAAVLVRLGRLHQTMGRNEKSVEELRDALKIAHGSGYQMEQSQSLAGLASGLISMKQYQAALEPIAEARELSRKAGIPLQEGVALNLEGKAYAALGEVGPAREAFRHAAAIAHQLGAATEASSLRDMAVLERDNGFPVEARQHASQALELVESLRGNIGSHASRMRIASSHRGYYDLAIELAMRAGDPAEAIAIVERGKARSLIDLLSEAQIDVHKGVDPALVAKEKQGEDLLDARHERLLRLLEEPHTPAREVAARRNVEEALDAYQKLQVEIRMKSPEYAAITQPRLLKLSDIQALLPEHGTAFVEFWLGESKSFAWLVSRTGCHAFDLPSRGTLEAAARRMHDAVSARNVEVTETLEAKQKRLQEADAEYQRASAALAKMLAGPLGALASSQRWWVVTDGALDYVPLAALPLPGGTLAAARHQIVNLPSASAAAEIAELAAGRSHPSGEVAIFADPVFRADDIRMASSRNQTVALRSGATEGLGSLPRLHFSREEADAISRMVAGKRKWVSLDFDANRAAVESSRLADFRIVHFATHGVVNTRRPELSGIVLSMVDRKGRPLDGFLALHEIYNLKLNADLVVLSGCETALGEAVRSEGLVGLTRGFLHAGSVQVLASLWSVPDRGAAEFIRRFYDAMLRHGQDAAAALNSAQVSMMQDVRWNDPYYWAAFRLEGAPGRRPQ